MPDRKTETGNKQPEKTQLNTGKPATIVLDSEVQRMMGTRGVRWNDQRQPVVKTEPTPQSVD